MGGHGNGPWSECIKVRTPWAGCPLLSSAAQGGDAKQKTRPEGRVFQIRQDEAVTEESPIMKAEKESRERRSRSEQRSERRDSEQPTEKREEASEAAPAAEQNAE